MYNFGEKKQEKNKAGETVEVWVLPKYEESKKKAIAIIEQYDDIHEGDFWILKNETKTGAVMYSGLIISHNACLKINETLKEQDKFDPTCITVDKDGYDKSLVFTYINAKQGIYEVGEVSSKNCKQAYPYAMALKRCFDRVVLKASKLAFDGIYSESESDTFIRDEKPSEAKTEIITKGQISTIKALAEAKGSNISDICDYFKVNSLEEMTTEDYGRCLNVLNRKEDVQ